MHNPTIESFFSTENMKIAMDSLLARKSTCGIDGVYLAELPEYWRLNSEKVIHNIMSCEYRPGIVKEIEIIAANGKRRTISLMNSLDRLLLKMLAQDLEKYYETTFSESSHAYRPDRGVLSAVNRAGEFIESGNIWVLELDIRKFFDQINHECLMNVLKEYLTDRHILELIRCFLAITIENDSEITQKTKGLIQGSPLSPLLSNIYLDRLDKYMDNNNWPFCRYGDDINIYCTTYEEALSRKIICSDYLSENLSLSLNEEKTGIYKSLNRRFLGYEFTRAKDKILVRRKEKSPKSIYHNWHTSALQKTDRNYHLINDGILTRKDYTILFENEEKKKYIPVEAVESLNAYANITFTSDFFSFMNQKSLRVVMYDKYGTRIGTFIPQNSKGNAKTVLKQVELCNDTEKRLGIARKMDMASLHNIRSNLKYYYKKNKKDEIADIIKSISECIVRMNECREINELLLLEARARQSYYQGFNLIISDSQFLFVKRTKRPPQDPLNSLISFGNTLLYQRIATEINKTSLDIRFAFVHASNYRSESLNLDVADLFKPILVDRTIFTLVNKKMLSPHDHFREMDMKGIYLNTQGKKIFIEEFEQKLYQKITYKGKQHTYDSIIRQEVQSIRRFIERGESYVPYKYIL